MLHWNMKYAGSQLMANLFVETEELIQYAEVYEARSERNALLQN